MEELLGIHDKCLLYRQLPGAQPGHIKMIPCTKDMDALLHCYRVANRYVEDMVKAGMAKKYFIDIDVRNYSIHCCPVYNEPFDYIAFMKYIKSTNNEQ